MNKVLNSFWKIYKNGVILKNWSKKDEIEENWKFGGKLMNKESRKDLIEINWKFRGGKYKFGEIRGQN